MNDLHEPRVAFVSQASMFNLAGSETLTFELVEFLGTHGWHVVLGTYGYGAKWAAQLASLEHVEVLRFADPALDETLQRRPPALAWIHHQALPQRLVEQCDDTVFVFNHMSAVNSLEFPFVPSVERELATVVSLTGRSTLDALTASTLLDGIDPRRLFMLGNPAPEAFWRDSHTKGRGRPRLLVVSNHLPDEVCAALEELAGAWEITLCGLEVHKGATPQPVTPELVAAHDAVLTIGKTVQYAIVAGIPAFVYDHFGGPGWLTAETYERARYANFSGRGFAHKTASDIAAEVVSGFADATEFARQLHASVAHDMLWPAAWARLEESLASQTPPRKHLTSAEVAQFGFTSDVVRDAMTIATHHESVSEHCRAELAVAQAERAPAWERRVRVAVRRILNAVDRVRRRQPPPPDGKATSD